jgi:hypothetical protein
MGGGAVTGPVMFPIGGQTTDPTTAVERSLSILDGDRLGFKEQRGSMTLLSGDNSAPRTQKIDPCKGKSACAGVSHPRRIPGKDG